MFVEINKVEQARTSTTKQEPVPIIIDSKLKRLIGGEVSNIKIVFS